MADEKITELDAKVTVHDTDLIPIVDIEAGPDQTKKVTGANFKAQMIAGHKDLTTGVHGVGASTLESIAGSQSKVDTHNALSLSHLVHNNDNLFSGYGAETIAGLRDYTKVPALTAISDPSTIINLADWYGASGAYIQADNDSDATHIEDDTANFPNSIRFTIVKTASNAAGDADTGIQVITAVDSDTLTIENCSGANFAADYYYWIKHSELIIPVTGAYLVTGSVLFSPAEADKHFQVRIMECDGVAAPTTLASSDQGIALADYAQPQGSWIIPLTAGRSIFLLAHHLGAEGTPTLFYSAPSHNPLAIFLLKKTA